MVTDHSEIGASQFDDIDIVDYQLWLQVLEAPGTAPLVGRARGLAASPSTLAISGPRGVGKRALSSLVHQWSERSGDCVRVECARLVAQRDPALVRADALVGDWFRAAEGGTLVLVDVGLLGPELQRALAARLPSVHGASIDRWSEPPRALAGPRADARVVLVLEAGGLDWLEPELKRQVAQHVDLPPLEAHRADVAVVVRTVLDVLASRDGDGPRRVTADGLEYLQRCVWPTHLGGLVRTVMAARSAVGRLLAGAPEAELDRGALAAAHAEDLRRPAAIVVEAALDASYRDAKESVIEQFEGLFFARVLERTHGNVSEAARQTGLDRSNFRRALRRARERAVAAHPGRRLSSSPESASSDAAEDSTRRYDSATHRIESGVRWQAADSRPSGDGLPESPVGALLESGEAPRPSVASARTEAAPPPRLQGTLTRR